MTTSMGQGILDSLGGGVDSMFTGILRLFNRAGLRGDITAESYGRELDYYYQAGYMDDPLSFFTLPENAPSFGIIERKPFYDGECQVISFESAYVAVNPHVRDRYHSYEANRTGYLVRWTHGDDGRKTVLCHHGYMLGEPEQAARMFGVEGLYRRGLDVALFIAPFHWMRSAGGFRDRGIYLRPDDVAMTCECVGQNQYDLYSSFLVLAAMGSVETGIVGASLGGYNAALCACLSSIASFAALIVPAVNLTRPLYPDRIRLPFPVDDALREKIRAVGEMHSPLRLAPKLPVDRILVVASRGDRLCPFEYVERLCVEWNVTRSRFLTGGHWLIFNDRERGRAWRALLEDTGFIPSCR